MNTNILYDNKKIILIFGWAPFFYVGYITKLYIYKYPLWFLSRISLPRVDILVEDGSNLLMKNSLLEFYAMIQSGHTSLLLYGRFLISWLHLAWILFGWYVLYIWIEWNVLQYDGKKIWKIDSAKGNFDYPTYLVQEYSSRKPNYSAFLIKLGITE